jgi:hypothetical protein
MEFSFPLPNSARWSQSGINKPVEICFKVARPTELSSKDHLMKLILSLLGVVLLIVAAVYFLLPADQLPSFMPGHEAGVTRMHTKHGIVAGVAGVVLLVAGWWVGRR